MTTTANPMHGSAAGAVYDALLAVWQAPPDTITHGEVADLAIRTAAAVTQAATRHTAQPATGADMLVRLTREHADRLRQLLPAGGSAHCCADCALDVAIHTALGNPVPPPPAYGECDAGNCTTSANRLRWYPDLPGHPGIWLPVCPAHAEGPDPRA